MMVIGHMRSSSAAGGPHTVYKEIHGILKKEGYLIRPFICSSGAAKAYHESRKESYIELTHYYRSRSAWSVRRLRQLWPAGLKAMIVHKPLDAWTVRQAVPDCQIVLVLHDYYQQECLHCADIIVAVSDSVAAWAKQYASCQIQVIYHIGTYPPDQDVITRDVLQFGFLGSFRRTKGLVELIQALRHTRGEYHVTISGKGSLKHYLRFACWWYGLDQVTITGWVDQVAEWYKDIDVLLLPSRSETFGLVLIEAMCRSKYVIASNVGGPSEIVSQGHTGYLVKPRSPMDLARAIQYVIDHPQEIRAIREHVREITQKNFKPEKMGDKWRDVARQLVSQECVD